MQFGFLHVVPFKGTGYDANFGSQTWLLGAIEPFRLFAYKLRTLGRSLS